MTEMFIPAREPDPFQPMVGIKATINVTVSANTRYSVAWVKAMRWAAYVIGPQRAIAAARWGALHLIRVRFDNGPWRWLRSEDTDQAALENA